MQARAYALSPDAFLRSVQASRDTLRKAPMKLIEVVKHVRALTGDAPYAILGGLAQILWARKTHTDDLDVALVSKSFIRPPARPHEANDVFEVYHLHYRGSVVDLLCFRDALFMEEILATARAVPELDGIRFIRPELLLVTHLLRPGVPAALAAIELVAARRERGDFDLAYAERWAAQLGRTEALRRTLARADDLAGSSGA